MPGEPPNPLLYLENRTFSEIQTWLENALKGNEALPKIVPDESTAEPILRAERALANRTRDDLREACRILVRRFTKSEGERETPYVQALLHLTVGLRLNDVPATDLQLLVADAVRFGELPRAQQKSVLFALLDLRVNLAPTFWQELAAREEGRLAVIAFAGLIRDNAALAAQMLPLMRDGSKAADALYVILRQEGAKLGSEQRQALTADVRKIAGQCGQAIQAAFNDWLGEQTEAPAKAPDPLASALRRKLGNAFEPRPMSARLLAA